MSKWLRSLSSRRAWIEITPTLEKSTGKLRRSPRGERGLKFDELNTDTDSKKSLSSRRAWIEMLIFLSHIALKKRRSPRGERGLKSHHNNIALLSQLQSLSSRRAWIEISSRSYVASKLSSRSPRGERGLKSNSTLANYETGRVALLAESVD